MPKDNALIFTKVTQHFFITGGSGVLFVFCVLIYFVCREQKLGVKRCRSFKKVENHWVRPTMYSMSTFVENWQS